MHNGKGRILQKRRCSGSEQLKEKKKGRERRASFHELSPVNTAKDLSSLLCTAALGSKSSWLNCYRFCWKKTPKQYFPAGFALTLPATQLTRVLAQRRNSSMLAETTAAGLPLAAAQSHLFFPPAGKTAISFPAGPLTQIIPEPNEQHCHFKGGSKKDGTAAACNTKERANQQLRLSNGSQFHTNF